MVSKREYRCRAHANPFRDSMIEIPEKPEAVDWSKHFSDGRPPEVLDIGCGYGRFLIETAQKSPECNVLGLEMREKVVEFVEISTKDMPNASVVKTNALIFLPNFFLPGSLKKLFVLFPDPHFKKKKQKARIICRQMMEVFRYLLGPGGELYIATDVESLFIDMCRTIEESGCFTEYSGAEAMETLSRCCNETDEAQRAGLKGNRGQGRAYRVVKE